MYIAPDYNDIQLLLQDKYLEITMSKSGNQLCRLPGQNLFKCTTYNRYLW